MYNNGNNNKKQHHRLHLLLLLVMRLLVISPPLQEKEANFLTTQSKYTKKNKNLLGGFCSQIKYC
jgi:hypothetical protein